MLLVCRAAIARGLGADADDVVQDTLLTAWRNWSKYDPSRGTVRAWLLMIAGGAQHRALRRRRSYRVSEAQPRLDPTLEIAADIDVRRSIDRLPIRQRQAVILYYYVDLSVADIAATLHIAEGTVKSALFDARRALAKNLGVINA